MQPRNESAVIQIDPSKVVVLDKRDPTSTVHLPVATEITSNPVTLFAENAAPERHQLPDLNELPDPDEVRRRLQSTANDYLRSLGSFAKKESKNRAINFLWLIQSTQGETLVKVLAITEAVLSSKSEVFSDQLARAFRDSFPVIARNLASTRNQSMTYATNERNMTPKDFVKDDLIPEIRTKTFGTHDNIKKQHFQLTSMYKLNIDKDAASFQGAVREGYRAPELNAGRVRWTVGSNQNNNNQQLVELERADQEREQLLNSRTQRLLVNDQPQGRTPPNSHSSHSNAANRRNPNALYQNTDNDNSSSTALIVGPGCPIS